MPGRTFLTCIVLQLCSFMIVAQNYDMSVLVHGKAIAKKLIKDDSLNVIQIKKKSLKDVSSIALSLNQKLSNRVYKKVIEITDTSENELALANESTNSPGLFIISLTGAN